MSVLDAGEVEQEESQIRVSAVGMSRKSRAFQGLDKEPYSEYGYASAFTNAVTEGFVTS